MKIGDNKELATKICKKVVNTWAYELVTDDNYILLQDEIQANLRIKFEEVESVVAKSKETGETEVCIRHTGSALLIIIIVPTEIKL